MDAPNDNPVDAPVEETGRRRSTRQSAAPQIKDISDDEDEDADTEDAGEGSDGEDSDFEVGSKKKKAAAKNPRGAAKPKAVTAKKKVEVPAKITAKSVVMEIAAAREPGQRDMSFKSLSARMQKRGHYFSDPTIRKACKDAGINLRKKQPMPKHVWYHMGNGTITILGQEKESDISD